MSMGGETPTTKWVIREISQPGHGNTSCRCQTTAERSAETGASIQANLVPAQDTNLIKCLLNPGMFCLGDE